MSTLWTPSGERPVGAPSSVPSSAVGPGARGGSSGGHERIDHGGTRRDPVDHDESDHDEAAELARLQLQLRSTPAADIVANHAIGLWQLAVLHLGLDDPSAVNLAEASVAIDAMAGIVEKLGARFGAHGEALNDALAQLRLAFVQQSRRINEP